MGEVAPPLAPTGSPPAGAIELPAPVHATARAWHATARAWILWLGAMALALGGSAQARWWWHTHVEPGPAPHVAALDLYARVAELTPITVPVGGADNAPWQTTIDELRRNPFVWRLLTLENWNVVPASLRDDVLARMLQRYRPVLMNPRAWDRMTAADWDDIPQPIRTIAYRHMAAYWAGFYHVGDRYGIDRALISDTLQAIVMSESWFEHRAERIDVSGNHDIGLVQASDFARLRLRQLSEQGVVDVSFTDADYWNPWNATRFLAVWMSLLLDEADGDLDRAVRAYNRGIGNADDPVGAAYLAAVERRRHRFIQNTDAPPAWTWLWHRVREIERAEWPWLHSDDGRQPGSADQPPDSTPSTAGPPAPRPR